MYSPTDQGPSPVSSFWRHGWSPDLISKFLLRSFFLDQPPRRTSGALLRTLLLDQSLDLTSGSLFCALVVQWPFASPWCSSPHLFGWRWSLVWGQPSPQRWRSPGQSLASSVQQCTSSFRGGCWQEILVWLENAFFGERTGKLFNKVCNGYGWD